MFGLCHYGNSCSRITLTRRHALIERWNSDRGSRYTGRHGSPSRCLWCTIRALVSVTLSVASYGFSSRLLHKYYHKLSFRPSEPENRSMASGKRRNRIDSKDPGSVQNGIDDSSIFESFHKQNDSLIFELIWIC